MSSYIPSEIVELILLNLPQKSLVRFSTVSKSWNSMISDARFIRRHKSRARLLRREKIILSHFVSPSCSKYSLSLLSLSSTQTIEAVIFPKLGEIGILALCDGICLVVHEGSLYLWNLSNRTHKKLPRVSYEPDPPDFCEFGLGFDSSSDDYKVLKINDFSDSQFDELYSLRSDSWEKVESFPRYSLFYREPGVSEAGGAFHTIVYRVHQEVPYSYVIVSFDLSTEKYGEVAPPPCSPELKPRSRAMLTAIRGKLCVYVNYEMSKFVLWVMQEYGIEKSWAKMFEIDYDKIFRHTQWSYEEHIKCIRVSPLHFYDNGEIYITVMNGVDPPIIMHIQKGSIQETVFRGCTAKDWIYTIPLLKLLLVSNTNSNIIIGFSI